MCEDDWKGPFTQSVAYFGAVFGSFIFGAISDYYGRHDLSLRLDNNVMSNFNI